jgi:type III pantothenate kinase
MTTLLLDAGNTRLKWAFCQSSPHSVTESQDALIFRPASLTYDEQDFETQVIESLSRLMPPESHIEHILLCNTAGDKMLRAVQHCVHAQKNKTLRMTIVGAQKQAFGVCNAYQDSTQLGADRWVALIAGRHLVKGNMCIIDCGTAMTVDLLDKAGQHLGGIIIPGMSMMMASLSGNTAAVGLHASAGHHSSHSVFDVRSTADAVRAGVLAGMIGAVNQLLGECQQKQGQKPICVLTGGDGQHLLSGLPGARYDADWVLKGLAIMNGIGCHKGR